MQVLILNGSPRPKGNTKQMIQAFCEGLETAGHEYGVYDVCNMNIHGCLACEYCHTKLIGLMELLEEKGTELREPYSAPLENGIFELRCKLGSNITRALYFFYVGKRIVVTNGFIKKTQKTPPGEI